MTERTDSERLACLAALIRKGYTLIRLFGPRGFQLWPEHCPDEEDIDAYTLPDLLDIAIDRLDDPDD